MSVGIIPLAPLSEHIQRMVDELPGFKEKMVSGVILVLVESRYNISTNETTFTSSFASNFERPVSKQILLSLLEPDLEANDNR